MNKTFTLFRGVNNLYSNSRSAIKAANTAGEGRKPEGFSESNLINTYRFLLKSASSQNSGAIGSGLTSAGGQSFDYKWITGWIDDDKWAEVVEGEWEKLFNQFGGLLQEANKVMAVFGASLVTKFMHRKIWTDAQPPSFDLHVKFVAENDAFEEVYKPARMLEMLAVPGERRLVAGNSGNNIIDAVKTALINISNSFLEPPGVQPISLEGLLTFQNATVPKTTLAEIQVGKMFVLRELIVDSAEVEMDLRNVDDRGYPLFATVKMRCEAMSIWTTDTLNNLMSSGNPTTDFTTRYDSTIQDSNNLTYNVGNELRAALARLGLPGL